MERTQTSEIIQKIGQKILLKGWVHVLRDHGKIKFLILRDIKGTIQCVISSNTKDAFAIAGQLTHESVVAIEGLVKEEKQAPGGVEIAVEKLQILSLADAELPIPVIEKTKNETEQSIRLDYRWIDLRKFDKTLIFIIGNSMEQFIKEFFIDNEFLQIHSPKIMPYPSESGSELFEVKYFERKAYLAQSPQFYKQMAMASGFERVFEIGPVFRAEPSFTARHTTEFTGVDFEMSYIESYQDVIQIIEKLMIYIISKLKESYGKQIQEVYGREIIVPLLPFPQISLLEAKKLLKSKGVLSEKEGDLNNEEEIEICKIMKQKTGHEFVFITEYPITNRAFYHKRFDDRPTITMGSDLLWNGLEISTSAQREHRYENLKSQALQKGLTIEGIKHYLDFFKYGCPPHGGAGLGFERILMKLLNMPNIRETTYLYRGVKRITP